MYGNKKKPLYGLDDTSRKFWLKVKEIFSELGLKVMDGDMAFYYLHEDGELKVQPKLMKMTELARANDSITKIIQGVD